MNLAEKIYHALAQDIVEDKPLSGLTLPALAERFSSSTRPVRQAVSKLVDDGLLLKADNGRLQRAQRIPKKLIRKISSNMQEQNASANDEEQLIHMLVTWSLLGKEDYVREEHVCTEFNIGRGRLRQLFHDYAGRGLLEHIPNCGWKVIPFREDDIQQFIKVRRQLEDLALCDAFEHLDHEVIKEMLRINKKVLKSKRIQLTKESNDLHDYFISCSGNRYIAAFFEQHAPYYFIFSEWEGHDIKNLHQASRQHCKILEAILNNDLEAARKALREHLTLDNNTLRRDTIRKYAAS